MDFAELVDDDFNFPVGPVKERIEGVNFAIYYAISLLLLKLAFYSFAETQLILVLYIDFILFLKCELGSAIPSAATIKNIISYRR